MKDRWLYRLERRLPWLAIPNLMLYIVAGTGVVYLCSLFFENVNAYTWLSMVPSLVAEGQVWRLITFVFLPETSNVFALLLSLYFYYNDRHGAGGQLGQLQFHALLPARHGRGHFSIAVYRVGHQLFS